MRGVERLGRLDAKPGRPLCSIAARGTVGDCRGERLPVDKLHRIEVDAARVTNFEDGYDVRMIQERGQLRFVGEPLPLPVVERSGGRQGLSATRRRSPTVRLRKRRPCLPGRLPE